MQNLKNAQRLYDERLPIYRRAAAYTIDVTGRTSAEVAIDIIADLGLSHH